MRRLGSIAALLLLALSSGIGIAAVKPLRVAFLYSDGNMSGTLKAYKALLAERPDLRGSVTISFLTESVFDTAKPADLAGADVLVLDIMNQQLLDRFNTAHKIDLIAAVRRRGTVFSVGEGLLPKEKYVGEGCLWDDRARAYWEHSGFANQLALLKYVLAHAGVTGLRAPDPQPSLDFGYYYPDGRSGQMFGGWEDFDAWRLVHGKKRAGAPRVAIGFYKSTYYTGDTELLDFIIAEAERQGADVIPMFGYPGAFASEKLLLDPAGARRADVALSFLFNFADTEAWKSLARVDIPVVNLVSLYGRTETEWRSADSGMSLFEGTFQMAVPELAGRRRRRLSAARSGCVTRTPVSRSS